MTRVFNALSSMRLSVYLLLIMMVFFFVGTLFPQYLPSFESYEDRQGKWLMLVYVLDLLDIFSSPLFLVFFAVMLVNLILCNVDRIKGFIRAPEPPDENFIKSNPGAEAIRTNLHPENIIARLKALGFRSASSKKSEGSETFLLEKGLNPRVASTAYHLGIFVLCIGLILSYLGSYKDSILIEVGEKVKVPLESNETAWAEMMGPKELKDVDTIELELENFKTTFRPRLELDYPKGFGNRFKAVLGFGGSGPVYSSPPESFSPMGWYSELIIHDGNNTSSRKIDVNHPFKYRGFKFYQAYFSSSIKFIVGNKRELVLENYSRFELPETKGEFMTVGLMGSVNNAWLLDDKGNESRMEPFVAIKRMDIKKPEVVARLKLGETAQLGETTITLKDVVDYSGITYRRDHFVSFMWISMVFALIGMAFLAYGRYYRLLLAHGDGNVTFLLTARGSFATTGKISSAIKTDLSAGDEAEISANP